MSKSEQYDCKREELKKGLCGVPQYELSTRNNDCHFQTFETIASAWRDSSRIEWKESTYVRYSNILTRYLIPEFRDKRISCISGRDVERFCIRLRFSGRADGNALSEKMTADVLSVLRRVFRYAEQNGLSVDPTVYHIGIRCTAKPLSILSIQEQQTLHRYLCRHMDPIDLGILLCMNTGIRIGELCALEWKDVSFQEKTIHIHQTMQRIQNDSFAQARTHVIVTSPKSPSANRIIPVPPDIFQLLAESPIRHEGYFLTGSTSEIVEPRKVQYRFQKILKRCNIEAVNFHVLRHTFATRCVEADVDIKTLSEILGHSTVAITMNRYVHPSLDLKRISMDKFSSYIASKQTNSVTEG